MTQQDAVTIRAAEWPKDQAVAAHLLRKYAAFLAAGPNGAASIFLTHLETEGGTLARKFTPPVGILLLAIRGSSAVGCVAVQMRKDRLNAGEMKRLWVEPEAQSRGLGRRLADAAIDWARERGAAVLLLDTVPAAMPHAAALYRSLGFKETARHNENDVAGLQFFQLVLHESNR